MKGKGRRSGILLAALLLAGLALMGVGLTATDYVAEAELPYYCLYQLEDEIGVTVRRQGDVLLERVVCRTERAEESAALIGWRSMVYWGYRGELPFASSYARGEEEPKMYQAAKDNYLRAKGLTMMGRDFDVVICVTDSAGEVLWQKRYHP